MTDQPIDESPVFDEISDDEIQYETMRTALQAYELDEEDLALLDEEYVPYHSDLDDFNPPVLAIIGRPNVGKSTLVNRILGRREAVVQDTPGVTRDRVMYEAEWAGQKFILVDTGGWEVDVRGLDKQIADQAEVAIELADAVAFVVDANVGATATDERVVRMLRDSGKPVVLVANKADSAGQESDVASLWSLGLGEPQPVSALHGRGVGDLLDVLLGALPDESELHKNRDKSGMRRVALVGRPNVGKSSLLNALAGQERAVVHDLAGTTRDPVDEVITMDDREWEFIDTAGIKRRMHKVTGADYYSSIRTQAALERSEVGVVLVDASVPFSEQDVRVIQQVIDAGRALVIVNNKWDLVDDERRVDLTKEEAKDLNQLEWAPRVNLSAMTTWHLNRLPRAIDEALDGWETRVPTGKLNAFLGKVQAANPHPVRGGKQPRILFATQASTAPPRFVIFTSAFLDPTYRRFLERRLREEFGFYGSPIQISIRVREKRGRKK